MINTTHIQPALTPEDWREILAVGADCANPHQTMALANAALPDDDPRKIRREDVEALANARAFSIDPASVIEGEIPIDRDATARLRALAAKLAALLPDA